MNQLIKSLAFYVLLFSAASCNNKVKENPRESFHDILAAPSFTDTVKPCVDNVSQDSLPEQTIDEIEQSIKTYVKTVRQKFFDGRIEDDSTYHPIFEKLDAYVENDKIYAIVKEIVSEKGERKMEFFYKNDSLICVIESYYSYKPKVDFEDSLWKEKMLSSTIPESTAVLQEYDEWYFCGNKLIRWRERNGRIGDSRLAYFKNAETTYLKRSKEYRAELQNDFYND
jgi:hypothetical protein